MGPENKFRRRKIDKRFLSKNQTIKLYKEKASRIGLFKKEIEELTAKYSEIDLDNVKKFDDFPLSDRTKRALRKCGYYNPTPIQKQTIMLALQSNDILGAAKTGSGKTLAFVIPILERLFVSGWSILDGLGAVIITPTRELAYQIYEVINKVGCNHQFSVGLIIGGKDLVNESKLIDKCNIMICTPGRLLHHMDQNQLFDAMNLKILVLDEADRMLSLGFAKTMDAIIENLPTDRQTLLFSATQTKSIKDLARLSLKSPVYISVDELSKFTTPEDLQQTYMVCEAHDKMNFLWSFLKSHKKQKVLVFMASCKQVKFTYESFCRLRPGVSIMALYGKINQLRRMAIYDDFCRKNHVVMIATDVAARGLDFPNVNWVVHLDCPEDVNLYIHRAGRTARNKKRGESLLVLLPSEKDSMIKQLTERKIPIEEIRVNPSQLFDIEKKLQSALLMDKNMKESGIRAFKAYLKNIFIMKDKSVFDVKKIDVQHYANSLGLDFMPRIRFLEKNASGFKEITTNETLGNSKQEPSKSTDDFSTKFNSDVNEENANDFLNSDKLTSRDILFNCLTSDESDDENDDTLLINNQKPGLLDIDEDKQNEENQNQDGLGKKKKILTKAALVKKELKKKAKISTVVKYDEEGNPLREVGGQLVPDLTAGLKRELLDTDYSIEKAMLLLEKDRELDKKIFREKIKSRHRAERLKKNEKNRLKNPNNEPPTLEGDEEASENEDDSEEEDIDPNNMSVSEESDGKDEESSNQSSADDESSDNEEGEDSHTFNKTNIISSDEAESSDESDNLNESNYINSDEAESSHDETDNFNKVESSNDKDIEKEVTHIKLKRKKPPQMLVQQNEHHSAKKRKTERTIEDDEELALQFLSNV